MSQKNNFFDYDLFNNQLEDMPIFKEMIKEYEQKEPFVGLNIIIAHVLVPNTLPMIACIKLGGATVTVIPSSPAYNSEVIEILNNVGCPVDFNLKSATDFDYAFDVGGIFADTLPKYGVIEVTRSGVHRYLPKKDDIAIISCDDSKCKLLETFIGNPQSTLLGISKFIGDPDIILKNKTLAVIGFGKIGRGIARLFKQYCLIIVCDINEQVLTKASELGFSTFKISNDKTTNWKVINETDFVISCTGFANVITKYFDKLTYPTLLNLGNYDEFGPDYSEKDIFMSKDRPFNFNNEPPTANKYIDPILASEVRALEYMIKNSLLEGFYPLPDAIDDELIKLFLFYQKEPIDDINYYF